MKRVYWRPHAISRLELVVLALAAVACLVAVERFPARERQPYYREKIAAARLALRAMETIKAERLRRDPGAITEADPAGSGLIGRVMSPVTTNHGYLQAKQTSANPNFAAVVVDLLRRAGLKEGDAVAIGFSGSFPAINLGVAAAVETLKLRPIAIASASGSQWGANDPDFLWIDMERVLAERQVFAGRSVAASRGGVEDRALGLTREGRKLLDAAIERNGVRAIKVRNYADSVAQRMAIYREAAGDTPIKAYVNVGGGTTSVGTRAGKALFRPGLNLTAPRGAPPVDSVMSRFAAEGVPVIHLVRIEDLAERYGLPLQPQTTPPVGEGKVFFREAYRRGAAAASIGLLLAAMIGFIRLDWGVRLLRVGGRRLPTASDPAA
jgi:poly-gamma-glutamate system protein